MSRLRSLTAALLIAALVAPVPLSAQVRNRPDKARSVEADEDSVVYVRSSDPEMNAAIAEAQRTLPEFLAVVAKADPLITNVIFKYPLGGKEHIWVDHVARDGDYLTGRLANVPIQRGYTYQQEVRVKLTDVSDWAYRNAEGVMQGHRTTRVLLKQADAATRQRMMEDFGWE